MADKDEHPPTASRWTADDYNWLVGFDGDWRDLWYNEDFVELMANRWELAEVESLLDVGCGAGHWGQRLAPYLPTTAKISGIDVEPAFAEKATGRAREEKLQQSFDYQAGTAEDLPYPTDSFACVTCQTVLMHVADPSLALQEMLRVLRPGGILVASEPCNMVSTYSLLRAEPRISWDVVSELLRFHHICELGKMALGQGDSSIGDRLPQLLSQAGLSDIQTFTNDNTATLLPPYATAEEKLDIKQQLEWIDGGVWIGGGYHDDALELFLHGGGDEAEFESLWALALRNQQDFKHSVLGGTLAGGRGVMHYLVSGRKLA